MWIQLYEIVVIFTRNLTFLVGTGQKVMQIIKKKQQQLTPSFFLSLKFIWNHSPTEVLIFEYFWLVVQNQS